MNGEEDGEISLGSSSLKLGLVADRTISPLAEEPGSAVIDYASCINAHMT